jgi:hypothetical protein
MLSMFIFLSPSIIFGFIIKLSIKKSGTFVILVLVLICISIALVVVWCVFIVQGGLSEWIWILSGCTKPNFRPHLRWGLGISQFPGSEFFTDTKFIIPLTTADTSLKYYTPSQFDDMLKQYKKEYNIIKQPKPYIDCDGTKIYKVNVNNASGFTFFETTYIYYKDPITGCEYGCFGKENSAQYAIDYLDDNVVKLMKKMNVDQIMTTINELYFERYNYYSSLEAFIAQIEYTICDNIDQINFEIIDYDTIKLSYQNNEWTSQVIKYYNKKNKKMFISFGYLYRIYKNNEVIIYGLIPNSASAKIIADIEKNSANIEGDKIV